MALFKTKQAVKYEKKHLLGIQDLSIPEIVHILNESQSFVLRSDEISSYSS